MDDRLEKQHKSITEASFQSFNYFGYLSCIRWYLIYLRIKSAVTLSPTVQTKHPSYQNAPPQSFSSTSGCLLDTPLALILFKLPTTSDIEYRDGNDKNKCTWSSTISRLSISISWLRAISSNIVLTVSRMSPLSNHFRYFGGPYQVTLRVIYCMTCSS